ncbi:MAG: SDR family NAD(P)-dependent oxidoreductase [Gammaproteobacteria bacterium]
MVERIEFHGRVAIVTGAGNGLGRDYALELARRGAKVVVNDLGCTGAGTGASRQAAQAVIDEIRAAGGQAIASCESVATRAGGAAIVQAALDAWGRVDICICNAGILRNNRFEDLTDEQIDAVLGVHLKGAFHVAQPAYRAMRAHRYGRFVFTGSASGMFGHGWQANYAAAKSALLGLSRVVAIEGSAHGILSNLLLPTAAESRLGAEMGSGYLETPAFAAAIGSVDFSVLAGRNTAAHNTALALYLASERCEATQSVFTMVGGRYARVGICTAEGWASPAGAPPTVEDVADHFARICDLREHHEPLNNYAEAGIAIGTGRRQGVL